MAQLVSQHERIDFDHEATDFHDKLRLLKGVVSVNRLLLGANAYRVELGSASATKEVLNFLVTVGITSLRTSRPSLEEVYVHVIGDRGLKV